ncbi:MAG: UDP-N-acetylmuramate dehydrogenase [Phycisphaerae bacterium]|nr:UDP-N-acetylmuramate dehydrogenase [Phycisphaerae bacterium]MDW8262770.1 UDP-N-acetylmuramate dehydrogenase [Phycisphaerales bacterium]
MHLVQQKPFSGLEEIVSENVPLKKLTWYRIGGPARYLLRPRSIEQLQQAVQRCNENGIRMYVLGLGANLLVQDQGVDGAVFKLDDEFWRRLSFNRTTIEVGAGVDMQKMLLRTCRQGLSGVECLAGIPGTVGGGIRMNAGGKFGDFGAVIRRVTVMDSEGTVFERHKDDLIFEYRRTNIVAPFILGATLELEEDDPDRIMRRTKEIWFYKKNTQPLNTKNCGCVFKNPRGLSAGALIDQAGLKGLRVGNAEVSAKHANFIIAHPDCSSEDVLKLIRIIREKVYERNQIELETEVQIWP